MKILAISGSLRPDSSNTSILKYLSEQLPVDTDCYLYDGIGDLPHFNPDLNHDNIPPQVIALRALINGADAVIICSPEYAFGIPGSLKNALDWTVSSGEFAEKPVCVITASSVGKEAHAALLLVLRTMSASVPDEATLLIPFIRTKVNAEGKITDAYTEVRLRSVLQVLLDRITI